MSEIPPLRVLQTGAGNNIPVFEIEFSGGTLTKVSPIRVKYEPPGVSSGTGGAPTSSPYVTYGADATLSNEKIITAGSSVVITTDGTAVYISALTNAPSGVIYAPTGGNFIAFAADGDLSNEKVLTASNNVTITTDASAVYISANISGKQDSITFPLSIGSGGTGRSTLGAPYTLLGVSSDGTVLYYFDIAASNNIVVSQTNTTIYLSAVTNAPVTYAPTGGNYVAFAADGNLSNEKVITAGSSVVISTDATAIYISALTNAAGGVIYAPTGGNYVAFAADANLSNERIITAGSSVVISTDATSIYISAITNAAGGVTYAPTGGNYIAFAADAGLSSEKILTAGSSVTIATDASAVYVTAITNNISGLVGSSRTISAGSGLTGGGDFSADRSLSVNTNVRDKFFGFFGAGNVSTAMFLEESRIYIPFNMEARAVYIAATTAPTGAAIIVNLRQHNAGLTASTAMFADANRPQIAASGFAGSSLTFDIVTLYAGSWLGINVDQCGSTNAGSNLTITLITRTS